MVEFDVLTKAVDDAVALMVTVEAKLAAASLLQQRQLMYRPSQTSQLLLVQY